MTNILLIFLYISLHQPVISKPLYTDSRWIVNGEGTRVKLACVNWPSHLQQVLAEGLHRKPVGVISKKIRSMGFNCVRFTWPTDLANNETLASTTVHDSFQSLGLFESIAGLEVNNRNFLNQTLIQAFQNVVANLGENKLLVVLDNHLTTPGWCCDWYDGSGFFGDKDFDPQYWLNGLTKMATLFKGAANVIGMSLRNEPRGPKQDISLWYKYMQQGAEAVHAANPDVLVILSGLEYARNLRFLNTKPVNVSFTKKLVFEGHWYAFSDGDAWEKNNPNDFCGNSMNDMKSRFGFLLEQGYPVFLSEFGANQRDVAVNDNRYFNCILGVLADLDLDWALWTLQGSYYLRQAKYGLEEAYGLLSWDWADVRNSSYLQRIRTVQSPFQGPGISVRTPYKVIFHPLSGECALKTPLGLGPCKLPQAWGYTQEKNIVLYGSKSCLQAVGMGSPPMLGITCNDSSSKWETVSTSKMHLSAKLANGETVCLDIDPTGRLVTNPCKCLEKDPNCEPASQWFKIITSVRSSQKSDNALHP
ncbi:cellulase [Ranunculus cassubicifolius]